MLNIYDIVYAEANTCESFQDRRLYQAWKSLKEAGIKWGDVFAHSSAQLQWDKISGDQVEEVEHTDIDKFIKRARKIKAGEIDERKVIAFGFKREKLIYIFDPVFTSLYKTSDFTKGHGVWYSPDNKHNKINVRDAYSTLDEAEYLIVVYADVNTASQMMQDRANSKRGMIHDLTADDRHSKHTIKGEVGINAGGIDQNTLSYNSYYRQCMEMAQEAERQRKNIVAKNKLAKNSGTAKIDKIVEDATKLFMKFSMWATKHPDDITTYEFTTISHLVTDRLAGKPKNYSLNEGILTVYSNYCTIVMTLQDPNQQYVQEYSRRKEQCETTIQTLYASLVEKCSKYGVKL